MATPTTRVIHCTVMRHGIAHAAWHATSHATLPRHCTHTTRAQFSRRHTCPPRAYGLAVPRHALLGIALAPWYHAWQAHEHMPTLWQKSAGPELTSPQPSRRRSARRAHAEKQMEKSGCKRVGMQLRAVDGPSHNPPAPHHKTSYHFPAPLNQCHGRSRRVVDHGGERCAPEEGAYSHGVAPPLAQAFSRAPLAHAWRPPPCWHATCTVRAQIWIQTFVQGSGPRDMDPGIWIQESGSRHLGPGIWVQTTIWIQISPCPLKLARRPRPEQRHPSKLARRPHPRPGSLPRQVSGNIYAIYTQSIRHLYGACCVPKT